MGLYTIEGEERVGETAGVIFENLRKELLTLAEGGPKICGLIL